MADWWDQNGWSLNNNTLTGGAQYFDPASVPNANAAPIGTQVGTINGQPVSTQAPGTPAPTVGAQGGGANGDPQSYFNSLFPGDSLTPDQLTAQEANLTQHGIKVLRNAAGVAGKIQLPGGQIVDVIQGAGSGLNRKQWLTGDAGGGGNGIPGAAPGDYSSIAPYGGAAGSFTPASYTPTTFTPVTGLNLQNDPGYLERLRMGTDAIQHSAAAKGSVLNGGTLKALTQYAQDYASNELGAANTRALQAAQFDSGQNQFGASLAANQNQFGATFNANQNQLGYQNRYGQYSDYLGNLNNIANRGVTAANASYRAPA